LGTTQLNGVGVGFDATGKASSGVGYGVGNRPVLSSGSSSAAKDARGIGCLPAKGIGL
jgi:hypothetical protein